MSLTPEQLEELVRAGRPGPLVEALAPLDEKARRKLSKTARGLGARLFEERLEGSAVSRFVRGAVELGRRVRHEGVDVCAALAEFGVCPLSTVKRTELWQLSEQWDALEQVLSDRRPEWLSDWLEHEYTNEFPTIPFSLTRRLIRAGLCETPTGDGYVAHLVASHGYGGEPGTNQKISDALLADPDLLEHEIWRIFEVDTRAFATLEDWQPSEDVEPCQSWANALFELAKAGRISRARLLDASLAGLTQALPDHALGEIAGFHRLLAATPEERAERQPAYLALLAHRTPRVVKFALEQVRALEKEGGLDETECLASLLPVLALETKGTAATALGLATRLAKRSPEQRETAVAIALEALGHASADVQEKALDLIEAHREALGEDGASRVAAAVDALSGPLRARASALCPDLHEADDSPELPDAADLSALRARVSQLPGSLRAVLGLEPLLGGVPDPDLPPPFKRDRSQTALLEGLETVEPIADLDALLDAIHHAAEVVEHADELERILDGLARLGTERPSDFALRTQALAKRIERVDSEAGPGLVGGTAALQQALRDLLATWIRGEPVETPIAPYALGEPPFVFIACRVREVAGQLVARAAAPLLALPTHRGGWIDPRVLVERARSIGTRGEAPLRADLIQALLRIAPVHRKEALAAASNLEGEVGRLLRFALGGDERPERSADALVWLAAARAREPEGDHRALEAALGKPLPGPDAAEPARYAWTSETAATVDDAGNRLTPVSLVLRPSLPEPPPRPPLAPRSAMTRLKDLLEPPLVNLDLHLPCTEVAELPCLSLHRLQFRGWLAAELQRAWMVRALADLWPQRRDAFYAAGIRAVLTRMDNDASTLAPSFAYLEPLFEATEPWPRTARVLVCVALCSKDADVRGHVADLLVAAVDGGFASADALGGTLARFTSQDWCLPNRVASALASVLEAGPLHADFVCRVLEPYVGSWAELPKNAHYPLELLLEGLTRVGRSLDAQARPALERARGKGKAAKLARALLELPGAACSAPLLRDAWAARIALAERWAGSNERPRPSR